MLAGALLLGCRQSEEQAAAIPLREDTTYLDSMARRRRTYEEEREALCRGVYERQRAEFSNMVGWQYDGEVDGCYGIFRYDPPVTAAYCDSLHPPEETSFVKERLLCHEGRYRTRY
jgi:hypothetical protein